MPDGLSFDSFMAAGEKQSPPPAARAGAPAPELSFDAFMGGTSAPPVQPEPPVSYGPAQSRFTRTPIVFGKTENTSGANDGATVSSDKGAERIEVDPSEGPVAARRTLRHESFHALLENSKFDYDKVLSDPDLLAADRPIRRALKANGFKDDIDTELPAYMGSFSTEDTHGVTPAMRNAYVTAFTKAVAKQDPETAAKYQRMLLDTSPGSPASSGGILPHPDEVDQLTTSNAQMLAQRLMPTQTVAPAPNVPVAPPGYQIQADEPPRPPVAASVLHRVPGTDTYRGPGQTHVQIPGSKPDGERMPGPTFNAPHVSEFRQAIETPIIKPEDIDEAFPFLVGPFRLHAGILKAGASMTSPENAAVTAGTGGLGAIPGLTAKIASAGLSAYFATQAGKSLLEKYPQIKDRVKARDWQGALELGGGALADAAMFYGAGKHAASELGSAPGEFVESRARRNQRNAARDAAANVPSEPGDGKVFGDLSFDSFMRAQRAPQGSKVQEITPPERSEAETTSRIPKEEPVAVSAQPLPEASGTGIPQPADTGGAHTTGIVETAVVPKKPLHEMSPDELDQTLKEQTASDGELLHSLFGEEGAKKYKRLERKANSSTDPAGADKAHAELERMEDNLNDAQRNRLYGITGPDDYNIEDVRSMRSALGRIDPTSPAALGESLKWAVTKFDPENPTADAERYAQLRHAAAIAHQNGWNTSEIMAHAFEGAAGRFRDPEDAAFMLDRFRRSAGTEDAPAQVNANRAAARTPTAAPAYGRRVNVAVPGEQTTYPSRYSLREASDIEPSHNPFNFEENPRYEHRNDRDYRNGAQLSSLVAEHSGAQFNPDYVTSESPTAEHGAPVIDARGNVLGGNSRAMTLARVYQSNPEGAHAYRGALRERAASFGLDPADVDRFERPLLVRELTGEGDPQRAITDFNKSGPAALSPAERAVADGRRLSPGTVTAVAAKLGDVGEGSTLSQALRGDNGADVVNRLVQDGVVTPQERNGLLDERGQLTGEAKDRISRMLVGRLFDSAAAYNSTPPELRGKLERIAPQVLRVEDRPDWSITSEVREAVNALGDARAHGIRNLDDLRRQSSLGGELRSYSPDSLAIADTLRQNPVAAAQAFRRYANDEALSREGGQVSFFQAPTRDEAFHDAFDRPAAARSSERGSISPELLTLGAGKFWDDDIAPKLHDAARAVADSADDILKVLAPTLRSESSQQAALILRNNLAEFARKSDQAEASLRQAKRAFDRMQPAENYEFIRRVEAGEKQQAPELEKIASVLRSMLDGRRMAVQALGTGKLKSFYRDYFPHIWADPRRAANVFAQFFGRGPLEGGKNFLKQRTHLTFEDGLGAGLKPVSDNPVDLVLLKVREMDKYLMAHDTLNNWKGAKLARYVDARTGEAPTGWKKITDPVGAVYGPSIQQITEYPNAGLWSGLGKVADALGVNHERGFTNLRGAVGRARKGGDNSVQTMHGTAEDVLAHEIGHQIDWLAGSGRRFVLDYPDAQTVSRLKTAYATLKDTASTLDDRRAARAEVASFKSVIAGRKEFAKQLRALADLRGGEKSYTHKREEKMAQLAEMWVGSRELFQRTAPKVFEVWKQFLDENPKLHALRDIEGNTEVTPISQPYDVGGLVIRGNWYAPEGAARILNNYLSPGLRDRSGIFRGLLGINNVLNQFQLGMSAFHLGFTAADTTVSKAALGFQALMRGKPLKAAQFLAETPIAAFTTFMKGDKMLKEWYTPGSQGAAIGNLVDNLVAAGGRARMDQMYRTQISDRMREALRRGNLIGAALRAPFAGVEWTSNLIMNEVVPRMKLGAFADLARFHMENLPPGATFEDARRVLVQDWNSVENRLGELTYDNLFWNRTVKDLAMITTRSVGWNLGTLREIGGGIADTVTQPANALRGKPVNLNRLSYLLGLVTVNAAMSSVYQYLKTGKGPDQLEDYFFPKNGETDENGRPQRVSWPTYVKDVFHYATHPVNTIEGKVAPIWSMFAEMIHNRDFFGTEIRNPDDPLVKQLEDLAKFAGEQFVPIGVRNYQRETKLGASPATRAEQFVGVTPAPTALNQSPAERLAREISAANAGDEPRTKEAADRRELRQSLSRSLHAGKGIPADVIEARRQGKLSKRDVEDAFRAAKETPLQQAFTHLGIDDAVKVYSLANPGEKKQLQAMLLKKARGAMETEAPAQRNQTLEKVRSALASTK